MTLLLLGLLGGCESTKVAFGDTAAPGGNPDETGTPDDTGEPDDSDTGDSDDTEDTEDPDDTEEPDDTEDPDDTGDPDDTEDPGDDTGSVDTDDTTGGDTGGSGAACSPYGLVAEESIVLAYGAWVDAYDSTRGVWSNANSSDDAGIAVNATSSCALDVSATVSGSGYTGGDPATVGCLGWGGSVSGGFSALSSSISMPTVAVPGGLPASSGDVTKGWSETWTVSADTTVDDLTLGYASELVFTTSVTVLVQGDLALDSATVTIPAGETVDLYLGGSARFGWGSAANTDGEPGRLRIHVVGAGGVVIDNGGALTATIEQPDGAFQNSGTFSGAWIGASMRAEWGAYNHLDSASVCP